MVSSGIRPVTLLLWYQGKVGFACHHEGTAPFPALLLSGSLKPSSLIGQNPLGRSSGGGFDGRLPLMVPFAGLCGRGKKMMFSKNEIVFLSLMVLL